MPSALETRRKSLKAITSPSSKKGSFSASKQSSGKISMIKNFGNTSSTASNLLHSKKKSNEFQNTSHNSSMKKAILNSKKKYHNFSLQKNLSNKMDPKPMQESSPNSIVTSPLSNNNKKFHIPEENSNSLLYI